MSGQGDRPTWKTTKVKSPFEREMPQRAKIGNANPVEEAEPPETRVSAPASPPLPLWRRILAGLLLGVAVVPAAFASGPGAAGPGVSDVMPSPELGGRTVIPREITISGLQPGDAVDLRLELQGSGCPERVTVNERGGGDSKLVEIAIGAGTGLSLAAIKVFALWISKRREKITINAKRTIGEPDGTSMDSEVTVTIDTSEAPSKGQIDAIAKALSVPVEDLKKGLGGHLTQILAG
jgi:hypothetical protein